MVAGGSKLHYLLFFFLAQKVWVLLNTPLLNHKLIEAVELSMWMKCF